MHPVLIGVALTFSPLFCITWKRGYDFSCFILCEKKNYYKENLKMCYTIDELVLPGQFTKIEPEIP